MRRTLGEEGGGCQGVLLFLTGSTGFSGFIFAFKVSGRNCEKTIRLSAEETSFSNFGTSGGRT